MVVKNCIFENCGNGTNGGSSNTPVFGADGSGRLEINRCLVYESSRIIGSITGTDDIIITNCTFANLNGGWGGVIPSVKEVRNTIVYKGAQNTCEGNAPVVSYSLFTGHSGAWSGPINSQLNKNGNMDQDPLFVDPANGDYRLKEGSPCIDAGDPNGLKDPDGTVADIGFFYYPQGTEIIKNKGNKEVLNNQLSCVVDKKCLYVGSTKKENIKIAIYDFKGKVISSHFLSDIQTESIDLSFLGNGIYCLKAEGLNTQLVKVFRIYD